jgi:hypothetical protein
MTQEYTPELFAEVERMKNRSIQEMALVDFDDDVKTLEDLGMDHDEAVDLTKGITRFVLGII